jgi:hypothetical protein
MSRRLLSMALSIGLLTGLAGAVPAAAADATPSAAFGTPEDAVTAYLQGVADANIAEVLASVAIDELAAGLDFPAYIDWLQAWVPFIAPMPATDPFYVEMNRVQQTSLVLGQSRMLIYSLLTTESLDGPVVKVDAAWAATFQDQIDPARLAGLSVVSVSVPDAELMTSVRYLANAAKQAAIRGADELTERVAVVSLDGQGYLVGFTLMRFGDSWKVASQSSAIAGTSATGAATRVDPS